MQCLLYMPDLSRPWWLLRQGCKNFSIVLMQKTPMSLEKCGLDLSTVSVTHPDQPSRICLVWPQAPHGFTFVKRPSNHTYSIAVYLTPRRCVKNSPLCVFCLHLLQPPKGTYNVPPRPQHWACQFIIHGVMIKWVMQTT